MATCKRSGLGLIVVVLGMVVGMAILLMNIPALGEITLGSHAVSKHSDEATQAREWVANHGGPFNRYDCPDGRVRYAVPMKGRAWAIMVVEGGVEVTSFISDDQGYVKGMIDPCKQWMNFAHP